MSIRTIMVSVDEADASDRRLELAWRLAERWDAKLTAVVFGLTEAPVVFADAYTAAMFDTASRAAHEEAEAVKAAAEQNLNAARCDWEVRIATGLSAAAAEIAAQNSLYVDLCILPTPDAAAVKWRATRAIEGVLFSGAAPALVVPADIDPEQHLGRRIALAWDARREAARAALAASPFLAEAESVDALTVTHFWGTEPYGPVPGVDFAHWLARHGAAPELRELEGDVAETILADVADRQRDLLVMGGYGHSRLREALIGGVTETMLRRTTVPLLLAH